MKVFVQIIDTSVCSFQHAVIEEPVEKGFEVKNAIAHLVGQVSMEWVSDTSVGLENSSRILSGYITGTNKIVTAICVGQEKMQNVLLKRIL